MFCTMFIYLVIKSIRVLFFSDAQINDFDDFKHAVTCGTETSMPPGSPIEKIVPKIYAYTRTHHSVFDVHDYKIIELKMKHLEESGFFNVTRQVVFIVHGFWNTEHFPWQYQIKDRILKKDDSTVFVVTWKWGAFVLDYAHAGANTQTMATLISNIAGTVMNLKTFRGNMSETYFYCIGHSLGAQICGQAGREFGRFDRVTGLDPAGPCFDTVWREKVVDNQSARCVDIIHTDGSHAGHINTIAPHLGTTQVLGHVDFYPNWGENQKGCQGLKNYMTCSHLKSIDYFIRTIKSKTRCTAAKDCYYSNAIPNRCKHKTQQTMGYFSSCYKGSDKVIRGKFYVETTDSTPYC